MGIPQAITPQQLKVTTLLKAHQITTTLLKATTRYPTTTPHQTTTPHPITLTVPKTTG